MHSQRPDLGHARFDELARRVCDDLRRRDSVRGQEPRRRQSSHSRTRDCDRPPSTGSRSGDGLLALIWDTWVPRFLAARLLQYLSIPSDCNSLPCMLQVAAVARCGEVIVRTRERADLLVTCSEQRSNADIRARVLGPTDDDTRARTRRLRLALGRS